MQPAANFKRLVEILVEHDVKFIIVGGVSAVLNGAPITTFDLDIVPDRTLENITRLLGALKSVNAVYRGQAGRRIEPDLNALQGPGHNLFISDAGPIDVLGTIGKGLSYSDLLPESKAILNALETPVLVLGLAKLIDIKQQLGFPKDLAVLPVLRKALEEQVPPK